MDISALVHIFVQILIVGGVAWLLWWLIGYIAPPEPFNKILRVLVAIVCVLFLINVLLGFTGSPIIRWR